MNNGIDIVTHAATDEYRDGWERIFGKKDARRYRRVIPTDQSAEQRVAFGSYDDVYHMTATGRAMSAEEVHEAYFSYANCCDERPMTLDEVTAALEALADVGLELRE